MMTMTHQIDYRCSECGKQATQEIPEAVACNQRLFERTRQVLERNRVRCPECEAAEKRANGIKQEAVRLQDAITTAGIPLKLATRWDAALGNGELMAWVWEHRNKGVFLAAHQRRNKTWVLAAALARMIASGEVKALDVEWWRMVDLEDRLSKLYLEPERKAQAFLERLGTVGILVIDDIDKGNFTKAVSQKIYSIIDRRTLLVPHGRLWLTSNNGGKALVAKMVEDPTARDCSYQRAVAIVTRLGDLCVLPPRNVFDWEGRGNE